jgi:hypothetical protein
MPLGEAFPVGPYNERHMRVAWNRILEQTRQQDLSGGDRREIIATNHLVDILERIVHDDGQVICGHTVVAS